MKFENEKLILTEEQLGLVKQASIQADPTLAAMFLRNASKQRGLAEALEHDDLPFYMGVIRAYRTKNFEVR